MGLNPKKSSVPTNGYVFFFFFTFLCILNIIDLRAYFTRLAHNNASNHVGSYACCGLRTRI
jgi:hypothetical protein